MFFIAEVQKLLVLDIEGGDIIIQAVLGGKSLGYEYTEDVLNLQFLVR